MIASTMRGRAVGHWNLTTTNWEKSLKLILYSHTSCHRTQCWPMVIRPLKPIERWKNLISGFLMSWANIKKKKKNVFLKCHVLLFYATTKHFSMRLWHATKGGFYTTTRDNQLSGWTEKKLQSTSQSQIWTKKRSWSLFGGPLPVWSTTAFWIPAQRSHLKSMLSKSKRRTENCNTCSQHWSPERVQFSSTTTCDRMWHNQSAHRVTRFCLIHCTYLTSRPSATSSSIATTVCRENASTSSRSRKWFPGGRWIPQHGFFFARTKHLFLFGKKCVDCNGSYFD